MNSVVQNLKLAQIRTDGETQSRVEINSEVVSEYAEALTQGEKFPPVVAFFDGVNYWLADGFHRRHAHKKIGALDISVDVRDGTQLDARIFSHGANKGHGLRRTNADKKKAVLGMLRDAPEWSDNKIAKHVGVDHKTVASHRASILGISQDTARTVERGGKTYQQDTSNIGKKKGQPTLQRKNRLGRAFESRPDDIPPADNDDELNEARFAITELSEENNALHDRLAVAAMDASDDEKQLAQDTIAELRARVKTLEAELDAVKSMRDQYMTESAEKSKQIAYWRKRAEKVAA